MIAEISADLEDITRLKEEVTEQFLKTIDDGEIEAMAILKSSKYPEHEFCTGDTRAIKALAVLSIAHKQFHYKNSR